MISRLVLLLEEFLRAKMFGDAFTWEDPIGNILGGASDCNCIVYESFILGLRESFIRGACHIIV